MLQKTIKESFSLSGPGIHSGHESIVVFSPANIDQGIMFVVDGISCPLSGKAVTKTIRGTTIKIDGHEISVVEHALAAVYGLGIDNVLINISGRELPILDGSALPYINAFKKSGIICQDKEKNYLTIKDKITINEGEQLISISPSDRLIIDYSGDFGNLGKLSCSYDEALDDFERDIGSARTSGNIDELAVLQKQGLALGANLENALAFNNQGKYLNALRFDNEIARHKILDIFGDLALLCRPVKGKITAIKSGHKLNNLLVRKLEEEYGIRY